MRQPPEALEHWRRRLGAGLLRAQALGAAVPGCDGD